MLQESGLVGLDQAAATRNAKIPCKLTMCSGVEWRIPTNLVVVLASAGVVGRLGLSARVEVVGSGVNYDGRTNGITAPSGRAQAELVGSVWADTEVDAGSVGHVVAHGTGTRLGDPVELNALVSVKNLYIMLY